MYYTFLTLATRHTKRLFILFHLPRLLVVTLVSKYPRCATVKVLFLDDFRLVFANTKCEITPRDVAICSEVGVGRATSAHRTFPKWTIALIA